MNMFKYIRASMVLLITGLFMNVPRSLGYTNPIDGNVTETVTNTWTVPGGELFVGYTTPNNSLIIKNGLVRNTHGYIGSYAGSDSNSVQVLGGTVDRGWHNSAALYIGGHREGTNWVDGGIGNELIISPFEGMVLVGDVNVSNIKNPRVTDIVIGDASGTPEMVIANGSTVRGHYDCFIGYGANESGSVEIKGEGSVWTAGYSGDDAFALYVGRDGSGNRLTVSDGGLLEAGEVYIGYGASSENNLVRVTGEGSRWDGAPILGQFGSGNRLEIVDGGLVTSWYGFLGVEAGSDNNSILVAGTGSAWKTTGITYVGFRGKGNTLTVSDGGEVHNSGNSSIESFVVGYYPGADNNAVFVTGNGSALNNTGEFYLGGTHYVAGGRGNALYVNDGGLVSIGRNMFSLNYSTVSIDDPGSRIEVGGNYYQDATSILRFGVATDTTGTPLDPWLSVGGTAEFKAGATLQYHSSGDVGALAFDRFYTNLIVEADQLIVAGVTNAHDLGDLDVVNIGSTLVDLILWEQNQDIYGLLSRRHLAESAGFVPGSQLALVSGEIDALSVQGNAMAVDQINILGRMSGSQQNAQLTQRYAQGSPNYQHNQTLIGGRNQVLSQSRHFQSSARSASEAPSGPAGPHRRDQGLRGWIRGYGGRSDYEGTSSFSGYEQNVYGTIIGVDKAYGNVLLGAAGGYGRSDLAQDNQDSSDAKTGYGVLYASLGTVDWFGDLSVGYGQSRVETRSGTLLGGSGSFTADNFAFYMGGGKEIRLPGNGGAALTPEAALMAGYYGQPEYADGLMRVDEYDHWSCQSRIGAALAVERRWGNIGIKPELRTCWLHEFNADPDRIGYTLIGGTGRYSFGVQAPVEDLLEVGLGLGIALGDRLELALDVDAQYGDLYTALQAGGRIAYGF